MTTILRVDASHPEAKAAKVENRTRFVMGLSLGTGIPGFISIMRQRLIAVTRQENPSSLDAFAFDNTSVSTPIGYGCYSDSARNRGFEYGVCMPYVSYGRGHPVYGERASVFVPLVGSINVSLGCVGATCQVPLFVSVLHLGITIQVEHPSLRPFTGLLLRGVRSCVQTVIDPVWRRITAPFRG
jgi:hypothetical protein